MAYGSGKTTQEVDETVKTIVKLHLCNMSPSLMILLGYCLSGFFLIGLTLRNIKDEKTRKKWKRVMAWVSVITIGAFTGLSLIWYVDMPQTEWHWFNDGGEWRGMDKLCHIWWGYGICRLLARMLTWTGVSPDISRKLSALGSFFLVGGIEVLDGGMAGYGASYWDLTADALGACLGYWQFTYQRPITFLKMEAWLTEYAALRPNLLGDHALSQLIKDYNGMTCWVGFRIQDIPYFKWCPGWLLFSVGYGASGMNGAHENVPVPTDFSGHIPSLERISYIAFSLDVDWQYFTFKSSWLNHFMLIINHFKLPIPSLKIPLGI